MLQLGYGYPSEAGTHSYQGGGEQEQIEDFGGQRLVKSQRGEIYRLLRVAIACSRPCYDVENDGLAEELHDSLGDWLNHVDDLGGLVAVPPVSLQPAVPHEDSSEMEADLCDGGDSGLTSLLCTEDICQADIE